MITGQRCLTEPKQRYLNLWEKQYKDQHGKDRVWVFASRNDPPPQVPVVNAVIVIATIVRPEGRFLLCTSEYRAVIGSREYGFVAGLKEPTESAEEAATRELWEESNLVVTKITEVSPPLISSAGLSDEAVQLVFCEAEGDHGSVNQEAAEDIETYMLDYDGVCELCDRKGRFEGVLIAAKAWPELRNIKLRGSV